MPSYLQQYHVNIKLPDRSLPSSNSASIEPQGTKHPLSHVLTYDRLSPHHRVFSASLSAVKEPTSYVQAAHDPQWRHAMTQELAALEANGIWTLQSLPLGKKPIGC